MKASWKSQKILFRIISCAVILFVGITGMFALANLKKPPAEALYEERPIQVEAMEAISTDIPVIITGYGQVQPLDEVFISSEIPGIILSMHPRLVTGEIIPEGDLLFEINPADYEAALQDAKALVNRWNQQILFLEKKSSLDEQRLQSLVRNQKLAHEQYERLRKLFEQEQVGTRSNVDSAEQAYNTARDQADQMAQAVALYPIQIKEAKSSLDSAMASLSIAETNLKRSRVYAPFKGRIKDVSVKPGQYVVPGSPILTLADDSVLEIQVPVDSRDARQWLRFNNSSAHEDIAWFSALEPVLTEIRWTEDPSGHIWTGNLHRVVKFDQQTRTVHLAIRVNASQSVSVKENSLPLVEGMFCSVAIPGRVLNNVYMVPRWAVSFDNTIFVSIDNRLKTIPVEVVRVQGETALLTSGIDSGDIVITTRMVNPLENSLLNITFLKKAGDVS
jgi:RND family efflux transporter MFP subunit